MAENCQGFIGNNREIDEGKDLPPEVLEQMYNSIKSEEIKMDEGDLYESELVTFAGAKIAGWLEKVREHKSFDVTSLRSGSGGHVILTSIHHTLPWRSSLCLDPARYATRPNARRVEPMYTLRGTSTGSCSRRMECFIISTRRPTRTARTRAAF